jgi:hypothetical protein
MNVKSIVVTYPDFQTLPKGVKKMLVASEEFFFGEARAPYAGWAKVQPRVAVAFSPEAMPALTNRFTTTAVMVDWNRGRGQESSSVDYAS